MSRRPLTLALAALMAAGAWCGCGTVNGNLGGGGRTLFRDHVFAVSTTLSGTVLMAGECLVARGSTLRIAPGSTILFLREDRDGDGIGDSRLRVEGTIKAIGEPGAPVVFSSAGDGRGLKRPGDWDAILLNFSRGSEFDHTIIEYSDYSIHAHFSDGAISGSLIWRNNDGCRLGNCEFVIEGNTIRENVLKGLNFRSCVNVVRGNEITGNGNGIFIFEKDAGSVIRGNNIHGNKRYNFRLDDFFTGEMVLDGNWWGVADEESIREGIYDSRQDPEIGTVILRPAAAPLAIPEPFDASIMKGRLAP